MRRRRDLGPAARGPLASYTSSSGPSLDHLGSVARALERPAAAAAPGAAQLVRLALPGPWLPERVWGHLQWLRPRRWSRRLDPTTDLLPWGREVRHNAEHSIDLYRANVIPRLREPAALAHLGARCCSSWRPATSGSRPRSVAGLEARCRDLTRVEVDDGPLAGRAPGREEFARLVTELRARPLLSDLA